jgi:hypothetical protein
MRKWLWIIIAITIGLVDGFVIRLLGVDGLGISLLFTATAVLFFVGEYQAAVGTIVAGSLLSALVVGRPIGWVALFGVIAITLIGLVKYFSGINAKWSDVLFSVLLLISLYLMDFLVARDFAFPWAVLAERLTFGSIMGWLIGGSILFILVYWGFRALALWIKNE